MDLSKLTEHLVTSLSNVATHGPAAAPLWAAVVWLVILLYRKRLCKFVLLLWGLSDPYLIVDVVKRVDIPLQLLLISLAGLPFIALWQGSISLELIRLGSLAAAFLAVHICVQAADLILSRLYLSKRHTPLPPVFRAAVLSIIYLVLVLMLLDRTMGVNILPLLATSSVIAAVLGLALQDTLKNVFAGLTMTLEKSVRPGDWVNFRIDSDNSRLGQVMEIGWRSTKIHTQNNNVSIIPNSLLIQSELVNYNSPSPTNGKVIDFPVSNKLQPAGVLKGLVEASATAEGVLADPPPQSFAGDVKLDYIVYKLRFWIDGVEKQDAITSKVIEACWSKIIELQS